MDWLSSKFMGWSQFGFIAVKVRNIYACLLIVVTVEGGFGISFMSACQED